MARNQRYQRMEDKGDVKTFFLGFLKAKDVTLGFRDFISDRVPFPG